MGAGQVQGGCAPSKGTPGGASPAPALTRTKTPVDLSVIEEILHGFVDQIATTRSVSALKDTLDATAAALGVYVVRADTFGSIDESLLLNLGGAAQARIEHFRLTEQIIYVQEGEVEGIAPAPLALSANGHDLFDPQLHKTSPWGLNSLLASCEDGSVKRSLRKVWKIQLANRFMYPEYSKHFPYIRTNLAVSLLQLLSCTATTKSDIELIVVIEQYFYEQGFLEKDAATVLKAGAAPLRVASHAQEWYSAANVLAWDALAAARDERARCEAEEKEKRAAARQAVKPAVPRGAGAGAGDA